MGNIETVLSSSIPAVFFVLEIPVESQETTRTRIFVTVTIVLSSPSSDILSRCKWDTKN